MSSSRLTTLVILACAGWLTLFVLDLAPVLRGALGGRWPYAWPDDPTRLLPLGVVLAVYFSGAGWWMRRQQVGALLGWAMVGQVALTFACLAVTTDPLFKLASVTVSGVATGWHYGSANITDISATLRHWPEFMEQSASFSTHLSIAPPGAVLIYSAATQLLSYFPSLAAWLAQPLRAQLCLHPRLANYADAQLASAWLGILMPLWSSLTVFPLYALGRRLFSETTARWSVLWWPLIPGLLLFSPTLNTVFPLYTTLAIVLYVEGLYRDRAVLPLIAGGLLSATTFVSFAVLPIVVLLGLFSLLVSVVPTELSSRGWRWLIRAGVSFSIGLLSVWGVVYLTIGLTPMSIAAQSAHAHLAVEYAYGPWLALHTNDYLMFTGWPLIALLAVGLYRGRTRTATPGTLLLVAVVITFGALIGVGILRGETGRILQFFTPLVLLGAAYALEQGAVSVRHGWALTMTQGLLVLGMAAVLRVVDTEFNRLAWSAPPTSAPIAAPIYASGAKFAETLDLESFAGEIETRPTADGPPQATLVLWLNWRAHGATRHAYEQTLLPINPQGELDGTTLFFQPFDGHFATTCWRPEHGLIQQRLEAPLTAPMAGGWWVSLALFDRPTAQNATVVLPNGVVEQQVGLGPFYSEP